MTNSTSELIGSILPWCCDKQTKAEKEYIKKWKGKWSLYTVQDIKSILSDENSFANQYTKRELSSLLLDKLKFQKLKKNN